MNAVEKSAAVSDVVVPILVVEAQTAGGRSWLHFVANVGGAILILGLGVFGFLFFGRAPAVPTDGRPQDAAPVLPLVEVADVKVWDQSFHLDLDGEATTYRILTVGAEVTGRVLTKPDTTRSGTFVNKGDLLFEIDAVNYQLDEQRLQARVAQAREELKAVEIDIENTSTLITLAEEENQLQNNHLERVRTLFERKSTSDSEMDIAVRQELTSRNALQTQQNQRNAMFQLKKTKAAGLKLAEAELERTTIDLQRCRIVSPITGRIVDDMKEEGDYVKPGDQLVHVSDSSRMEIKCSLKGQELAWVWQHGQQLNSNPIATSETATFAGDSADGKQLDPFKMPAIPCEIAFEFEGVETIWDGYLSRYEGSGMDRATRMFPCRVIVDAPEKTRVRATSRTTSISPPILLSGMYVTVRIPIDSPVPLLRVPAESIRPGGQLWIVREGKLKIVAISLVRVDGDSALVRQEGSALQADDQVIISPLASITDGMAVTTDLGVTATVGTAATVPQAASSQEMQR